MNRGSVILIVILILIGVVILPAESDITVNSNLETNSIQVESGVEEIIVPINSVSIQSNLQSSEKPVTVEYNVTNERTDESVVREYDYNITDGEVSANHALRIRSFDAEDYPVNSNTNLLVEIKANHPDLGTSVTTEEFSVIRDVGSILYSVDNPNPTTLTDYQVKVKVDHRNGMGSNFENIDFKQNGESLPFWIEEYNSGKSATIWVKTNELNANSGTELELIYGDSVSGTNSGSQVFSFYDGFNDGSIGSEWTDQSGATLEEENGKLKISVGNLHTANRVVNQPGTKVEAKAEFQSGTVVENDNSGLMIGDPNHEGGNSGSHANVLNIIDDPSNISAWSGDGSVDSYNICAGEPVTSLETDTPTILGISDPPSSDEVRLYIDNQRERTCSGELTGAGTNTFVIGLGHFSLAGESETTDTHYDWVRTRKQAESPVTVSKK